jgi:hypothetical protein
LIGDATVRVNGITMAVYLIDRGVTDELVVAGLDPATHPAS